MTDSVSVGVLGVGSMGRNHVRAYRELPNAELVGVSDADTDRAQEIATAYDTKAIAVGELLEEADAISIVVPTRHHFTTAKRAIEHDVDLLVEKPFVHRIDEGHELIDLARERDVTLQVGHVERFNPAVRTVSEIVPDLELIALDAMRLGPPVDRDIDVDPVLDLMIHDIDVIRALVDQDITDVTAVSADNDPYVTATLEFADGLICRFTASRVTQEKVRQLSITARECQVRVDYIDQSVEIHRQSLPEYVEQNGDIRYRHQNVVERPTVANGEPLKAELSSFLEAVTTGADPVVTGEDGLTAIQIARKVTQAAGLAGQPVSREASV